MVFKDQPFFITFDHPIIIYNDPKMTHHRTTKPVYNTWIDYILTTCFLLIFLSLGSEAQAQNKKVAIFGSSVAKGTGDTTATGGYTGFIKQILEKRGWTVVNISRGGDNTVKIMPRYASQLLPEKAKYVILGLSLGNEGIYSESETTRNRIFERYRSGMLRLIELCRQDGMVPFITNCYARNDFQLPHYEATKKMNLIINTWDVPSMNTLGTIDNGRGNWLEGFWHDAWHPNVQGHKEMFYAFVPSIFDAMDAGKKTPCKVRSNHYLQIRNESSNQPLTYIPDDTIHSFAVSFLVKAPTNGTLATIKGTNNYSALSLNNNKIEYKSTNSTILMGDTTQTNNGWIYVVVSHQWASGKTTLFVNGQLVGTTQEKLNFNTFILGGTGGEKGITSAVKEAGFKDLLIYRSALNPDEAKALFYDQLLQSSLEIYASFDDLVYKSGSNANNYAQSLSRLSINSTTITSNEELGSNRF